jgi:predicted metalloprotease with PDZ domain
MFLRRTQQLLLLAMLCGSLSFAQQKPASKRAIATREATAPTITVAVDATEAPRKIFHAHMTIPASAGAMTLLYPKWIPGEHGPTGPVVDTAGLKITAGGQTIPWTRDGVDMYAYHITVPQSATSVDVQMDYLSPVETGGFSAGSSATAQMAVISWNWLVLYPKGYTSDAIQVKSTLKLPQGWTYGTALPGTKTADGADFQQVSLTTLVDSPVITGRYLKVVPLQQGTNPPHEMDIAADSQAALEMRPEQKQRFDNLVVEAANLFGARHYRDYHFLLSLSDHVAHFGLEHHESNDSRLGERYLVDETQWATGATLLPHEYTHSWNGKYRRPAGLATPNYDEPMQGQLLWVYEGLTEYFGYVLTGRSSLWSPDQIREQMANIAAEYSRGRPGRQWRALEDTATAAQTLYSAGAPWTSWRRSVDYYDEGALIWLEADAIIRSQTNNTKSMDDFAHLFHGGQNTPPMVKTYTFDDVVNTLNQVAPYDWRKFLTDRIVNVSPAAPVGGIEKAGWKLFYNDQQSDLQKAYEDTGKAINAAYSVGLLISQKDGRILDTIHDGLAAKAGIGPGMIVVAVNGRRFTPDVFRDALRAGKTSKEPLQLLVENADYFKEYSLDYHDGPMYPHLMRDQSKPDLLTPIFAPKVTKAPPAVTLQPASNASAPEKSE